MYPSCLLLLSSLLWFWEGAGDGETELQPACVPALRDGRAHTDGESGQLLLGPSCTSDMGVILVTHGSDISDSVMEDSLT